MPEHLHNDNGVSKWLCHPFTVCTSTVDYFFYSLILANEPFACSVYPHQAWQGTHFFPCANLTYRTSFPSAPGAKPAVLCASSELRWTRPSTQHGRSLALNTTSIVRYPIARLSAPLKLTPLIHPCICSFCDSRRYPLSPLTPHGQAFEALEGRLPWASLSSSPRSAAPAAAVCIFSTFSPSLSMTNTTMYRTLQRQHL